VWFKLWTPVCFFALSPSKTENRNNKNTPGAGGQKEPEFSHRFWQSLSCLGEIAGRTYHFPVGGDRSVPVPQLGKLRQKQWVL
jgi:hypothetical protein